MLNMLTCTPLQSFIRIRSEFVELLCLQTERWRKRKHVQKHALLGGGNNTLIRVMDTEWKKQKGKI